MDFREQIKHMINKFNVEKIKQLDKVNGILSIFFKKKVKQNIIRPDTVENILLVDFALIGDMIMNIPFLKNIKSNCSKARITMVCMPWAKVILEDQGLIDEFIIFDGKNKLSTPIQMLKNFIEVKNTLNKINKKTYQIGFEPKGDLRHILFLHYTKCERSISYNYTGGTYLITDSFEPLPETKHLIDEKLDLLKLIGFNIEKEFLFPKLELSGDMIKLVQQFSIENKLDNKMVIGIHPGASNINKQYRYYPELVKKLVNEYGNQIIFCIYEGNGEKDIVDRVCAKLVVSQYIRVKRSLKEYVSLISVCNCMICNDSAAGHIAAAYGIPVLVLFGPVNAETAAPRGFAYVKTISKEYGCKPCTLPVCPLGTEICIKEINVSEVFMAAKEMIQEIQSGNYRRKK